ncbi:MAG: dienelactone hydrolase family protein [Janthinobacterium lividum]
MTKTLYTIGIIFLGLTLASGLLQGVIYLLLGPQIYFLEPFLPWFFTAGFISLIGLLFLLKYYYFRRFWFTFYTGTIYTVANLCLSTTFSYMLLTGKLVSFYYAPTFIFTLLTGAIYGLSLLFSIAGKRPWLKAAGLFTLMISLTLLSISFWGKFFPNSLQTGKLKKINEWIPLINSLLPALYIMNFLGELKILQQEKTSTTSQKFSDGFLGTGGILAFMLIVVMGTLLVGESSSTLYWQKHNAQQAQQMVELAGGTKTYVNSKNDSLHYILIKPMDYDPKKKYPLVVCLPYAGYEASAAELLSNDTNRIKYQAFIFVPECPPGSGWGGIPNYPSVDSLVYKAISTLDKEPGIDTKRRYVTGVSRGGYGSWKFICTRPDMFAAAIPVSGGGNPKFASKIINIPIWAFHGAKDKNVPVSGSRDMIEAIKKAGGNPKYTEYPNEAHGIWNQVSTTPGLFDWLFAQKRD